MLNKISEHVSCELQRALVAKDKDDIGHLFKSSGRGWAFGRDEYKIKNNMN
jgi:hypothetical protein